MVWLRDGIAWVWLVFSLVENAATWGDDNMIDISPNVKRNMVEAGYRDIVRNLTDSPLPGQRLTTGESGRVFTGTMAM